MNETTMAVDLAREVLSVRMRLGPARTNGPLTLVPVFGAVPTAPPYVVGAQALSAGTLVIEEIGGGTVPKLVAKNAGDLPLLLIDGEHLVGAKQNRILNASVLLAARHDTVLPVTCVEQGRWHYGGRADFVSGDEVAFSHLRAVNKAAVFASMRSGRGRASNQGTAWAAVSTHLGTLMGKPSPTGALGDAHRERRTDVDTIVTGFGRPHPDQTGVMALIAGRVAALDAFDKPATLASLWSRLLAGYALDTLEVGTGPATGTMELAEAEGFLRSLAGARATGHEGIGLGMNVLLTGPDAVADALVWEGSVVHLSAFPAPTPQGASRGTWTTAVDPIANPERRSRIRRYFHNER